MKTNAKILSALFLLTITIYSCTKEKVENDTKNETTSEIIQLEKYNSNCRMKSINEENDSVNFYYNGENKLIKFDFGDSSGGWFITNGTIDFDNEGRPSKMTTVAQDSTLQTLVFTYFESERKIEIIHKDSKENLLSTRTVFVDNNNNITKIEFSHADGKAVYDYTYNSSGNLISCNEKYDDSITDNVYDINFDTKTNSYPYILKILFPDWFGFIFASKNNVINYRISNDGEPDSIAYLYNNLGLPTEMKFSDMQYHFEYICQ